MADFTWSYSSLKQYQNCPKQYQEMRVLKNYTVTENEAMMYGKEVHSALEDYVKEGVELAKNYQRFKPMVDKLIAIPGDKYPEYEMALTYNKEPCDFKSDNRWVRGIADLVLRNVPFKLTFSVFCQSLKLVSSSLADGPETPALLMSALISPK